MSSTRNGDRDRLSRFHPEPSPQGDPNLNVPPPSPFHRSTLCTVRTPRYMSRRALLQGGLVGAAGLVLTGCDLRPLQLLLPGDLPGFGHRPLRAPGSLPYPFLAAGTDTLPQIDHIVVVMLENHSYDNILGSMGN